MVFIKFFISVLKGMLIGAGAIMPGVSGGTIAVLFKLYDKIMDAIANVFKDFKRKFNELFPVAIGGVIGVFLFSLAMTYLFKAYEFYVISIFIGLMAGSLPSLFKTANKTGFKNIYVVCLVISLAVTIFLGFMDKNTEEAYTTAEQISFFSFILYGATIGMGLIIPGISSSFILVRLGVYDVILSAIPSINLSIIIPVGLGLLFSIVIFANLITFLFKKAYGYTYYIVLGFLIGSIVIIFPPFSMSITAVIYTFLMILGFVLSYILSKSENRDES